MDVFAHWVGLLLGPWFEILAGFARIFLGVA